MPVPQFLIVHPLIDEKSPPVKMKPVPPPETAGEIKQSVMKESWKSAMDMAAVTGAGPRDRFLSLVLPQCREGYVSAAILGSAHTLGEFGVVLMIGGNIPGETRVISVQELC